MHHSSFTQCLKMICSLHLFLILIEPMEIFQNQICIYSHHVPEFPFWVQCAWHAQIVHLLKLCKFSADLISMLTRFSTWLYWKSTFLMLSFYWSMTNANIFVLIKDDHVFLNYTPIFRAILMSWSFYHP